jgi:hypothetical protein
MSDSENKENGGEGPIAAPGILRCIAVLLIVQGTVSVVHFVAGFFRSEFVIDFGFVSILLGSGLLARRNGVRKFLMVVSLLAVVCMTIVWIRLQFFGSTSRIPYEPEWLTVSRLVLASGLSVGLVLGLRYKSVIHWFEAEGNRCMTHSGWTWPIVFATAIFAGIYETSEGLLRHRLNHLYSVHTRFKFVDSTTHQPIKWVGITLPLEDGSEPPRSRDPLSALLRTSVDAIEGEGMEISVDGYAAEPKVLTFRLEGYEPIQYTLLHGAPDEVTLCFTPQAKP